LNTDNTRTGLHFDSSRAQEVAMSEPSRRRIPPATAAIAGIMLAVPVVALLLVGTYARKGPELWGFPFFYWYQFLWVFLAAGLTYSAYVLVTRARRDDGIDR
jgi:hypothetical protein